MSRSAARLMALPIADLTATATLILALITLALAAPADGAGATPRIGQERSDAECGAGHRDESQ